MDVYSLFFDENVNLRISSINTGLDNKYFGVVVKYLTLEISSLENEKLEDSVVRYVLSWNAAVFCTLIYFEIFIYFTTQSSY